MHLSHASTQDVETTSGSPLAQRRRAWSTSVIVLVIVGLIGLAAAQAQADPLWREATPAVFAAGVQHAPTAEAHFADVSCASAGNCTAVGDFINAGGYQEAFAQTQTHGEWGVASRNLVADSDLYRSRLTHISCSSAGSCTAVGEIDRMSSADGAFALTQSGGVWTPAAFLGFPSGSSEPHIYALSCSSAGNCTAVGDYMTSTSDVVAFAITQSGGAWGPAELTTVAGGAIPAPTPGHPSDRLDSVACASAGNCTAAGRYSVSGGGYAAFTQTQTGGVWGDAVPVSFPGSSVDYGQGGAGASAVSCTTAVSCTLVGSYRTNNGREYPFSQTRTGGVWGPVGFPLPANDFDGGHLLSVSCSGAGDCTAVGDATFQNHHRALAVTQTGGSWSVASLATFAAGVENTTPDQGFVAISCASAGNCTAVGYFRDAMIAGYSQQAFARTQVDGIWGEGVPVRFASGVQYPSHEDFPTAVSCPRASGCTMVGTFVDAGGDYQAFAQSMESGPADSAPLAPSGVEARPGAGQAVVSWSAPGSDGGSAISSYVVTGSPGGASCTWTAGPLSCTVPGLTNGVAYTFTVVAANSVGSSPSSVASSAVTPRAATEAPSASAAAQALVSTVARTPFSPAPGITLGATRGAVTLAVAVRASCRDLVRGANIWVRPTSRVTCVRRSLPTALSLRNGLVRAATPGAYPITVRINRANGTQVTRAITVTVR